MKKLSFTLGALMLISSAYCQINWKDSVITKLREIREEVLAISSPSTEVKTLGRNCALLINHTLLLLNEHKGNYPSSYVDALHQLTAFTKEIRKEDSSIQKQMLPVLYADIKLKFMERGNQMNNALYTDLVDVQVVTVNGNLPIKNLRVRYSLLGYKVDYSRPQKSFQRLTSPCNELMVPGYYEIWVTRDGDYKVLKNWSGEIRPDKTNIIELAIEQ
jgi:hypothetical protein